MTVVVPLRRATLSAETDTVDRHVDRQCPRLVCRQAVINCTVRPSGELQRVCLSNAKQVYAGAMWYKQRPEDTRSNNINTNH